MTGVPKRKGETVQVRNITRPDVSPAHQSLNMERTMMDVRRHWFAAQETTLPGAVSVRESGGELLMCLNGTPAEMDALLAGASDRGAYVVVTSWSRPTDLSAKLQGLGYRLIHRHGSYVYTTPPDRLSTGIPERRGLLAIFGHRLWRDIIIEVIGAEQLTTWNQVCWTAFGQRGTLQHSLQEKQRAQINMGDQARWYLAHRGGRPVGTACVYYGPLAAQVMAVGTLPSQQGRGVATAMMRQVIQDWECSGNPLLFLDTKPNGGAERLYQRLGFQYSYIREVYAPSPG